MVAKPRSKSSDTGTDTVTEEKPALGYVSSVYSGPDAFSGKFLEKLEARISEYLTISGRLAAADGDEKKAVENFIASSDDAKMVDLRAAITAAQDALKIANSAAEEYAGTQVKSESLTDDQKNGLREQMKTLREKVKIGEQTARESGEMMEIDKDGVDTAVAALSEKMPTAKRGKAKGSEGSTLPRAYASLTVSGGNMTEAVTFPNFSRAAIGLNTEVELLQKAFANSAGVAWENIKTVETSQSFDFSPDEKRTYHIVTTPTARPGRKAASDSKVSDDTADNSASASTDAGSDAVAEESANSTSAA